MSDDWDIDDRDGELSADTFEEIAVTDPKLNPNEDGLVYDAWMKLVDRHLAAICGLTSGDLADFPSFDSWNDNLTPLEGAEVCLEYSDFPEDMLNAD